MHLCICLNTKKGIAFVQFCVFSNAFVHFLSCLKAYLANAELDSETCNNHKWCDAELGDLFVIVKPSVFLIRICKC